MWKEHPGSVGCWDFYLAEAEVLTSVLYVSYRNLRICLIYMVPSQRQCHSRHYILKDRVNKISFIFRGQVLYIAQCLQGTLGPFLWLKTGIVKCGISKTASREGDQNLWLSYAELRTPLALLALNERVNGGQFHSCQPSNGLHISVDYLIIGNLYLLSAISIHSQKCRIST